ncbi:MAG: T9SS type A sorting domain-containing protein [Flavobacterium sp.]|uniref:T9SS type A sorting domain-containing protein n=1 Tax=Flavobacterium sp. TaxID=239 RepID=UPI003BD90CF8
MSNKLILCLFCSGWLHAQSISKTIIGSTGKTLSNSSAKISLTIGEPVVGLMMASGIQLGNGFYPSLDLQALNNEEANFDTQIKIYPNPTTQLLFISHQTLETFSVEIHDVNGKSLFSAKVYKEQPINISSYAKGAYFITVTNSENKKNNTYKIIKN